MAPAPLRCLLLGALAVQGCHARVAAPVVSTAGARGSLAWQASAYGLQQASPAALRPFARDSLAHVELYLYSETTPDTPAVLLGALGPDAFDRPLWIDALTPHEDYVITVKAYQPLDALAPTPLVEAQVTASSVTRFEAGAPGSVVDLDAAGGIRLVLADRAFVATAPGDLTIRPGALHDTTATESLGQGAS